VLIQKVITQGPFSVRELADAAGVSPHALYSWASKRRTPQPDSLRRLAAGLRRRGDDLQKLADELDRTIGSRTGDSDPLAE
jgi:transcriptional regulator with XRE-family HTH domain